MIASVSRLCITADMLSCARAATTQGACPQTVPQLVDLYMTHCISRQYSPSYMRSLEAAMQRLSAVSPGIHPDSFDLASLETARQLCVLGGVTRRVANNYGRLMLGVFKWARKQGYCSADTVARLTLLEPLQPGRTAAHDNAPRKPVPSRLLKATLRAIQREVEHADTPRQRRCSLRLWTLIVLQLRTGARPGEACSMRWSETDTTSQPWLFQPAKHKTAHRGITRMIPIGPQSQAALHRWCRATGASDHILGCDIDCYRENLYRLCDRHGLERFHPHQLRHSYATWVNRIGGEKAAQILLGHQHARTTRGYIDSERSLSPDERQALDLVRRIG